MLMKQLLCFGDSNTWGLIPKSNSRYSQSVRWTGLLQQKLWRSGVHVREEGLCGRTTVFDDVDRQNLNGLRALTELLESADPPDAAVLMLGTNDCNPIYHADAKTTASRAAQMNCFPGSLRSGFCLFLRFTLATRSGKRSLTRNLTAAPLNCPINYLMNIK